MRPKDTHLDLVPLARNRERAEHHALIAWWFGATPEELKDAWGMYLKNARDTAHFAAQETADA